MPINFEGSKPLPAPDFGWPLPPNLKHLKINTDIAYVGRHVFDTLFVIAEKKAINRVKKALLPGKLIAVCKL